MNATASQTEEAKYILLVNTTASDTVEKLRKFTEENPGYATALLRTRRSKISDELREKYNFFDKEIVCDFSDADKIEQALAPIVDDVVAVTCRGDNNVSRLKKVVPFLPDDVKVSSAAALEKAVNKQKMRRAIADYDADISPRFTLVEDFSEKTIKRIKDEVGFPLVIKPTGLASSLLVTIAYHEDELKEGLERVFRKIDKVYRDNDRENKEKKVLVEEFMEGQMYSIDGYVDDSENFYWCPLVHVKTGQDIGFDDFFGYRQMTPVNLSEKSALMARAAAEKSVRALGLESTTVHVELMRTEAGWKIVELGPRIGGFRKDLYEMSYGIDHFMNDLRIHLGRTPKISSDIKGYSAALKIYARKEGKIEARKGIRKIKKLKSFQHFDGSIKEVGERARFAKHGGDAVCKVILHNETRSGLFADIRRIEKNLEIEVA